MLNNDISNIIYCYVHKSKIKIVHNELLIRTSELTDYIFNYDDDDPDMITSAVQRCCFCGYKWLYIDNDSGGYGQCIECFKK